MLPVSFTFSIIHFLYATAHDGSVEDKTLPDKQVMTSQSINKQINQVNLRSYYYVTGDSKPRDKTQCSSNGKIILGRQLEAIFNILLAANIALKVLSNTNWSHVSKSWQKYHICVSAAVSDKISSM